MSPRPFTTFRHPRESVAKAGVTAPIGPVRLTWGSSQPAFAPAVMLHLAIALAAGCREPEIEFLDVFVGAQIGGGAIHHHTAVFEDVAVIGVAERDVGVLFGDQEADLFGLVETVDDGEDLLNELRRQAQ